MLTTEHSRRWPWCAAKHRVYGIGNSPSRMSGARVTPAREIKRQRRRRAHSCWDHLIIAPLWPKYGVNLGTLLRTCDAVGACMAVPKLPWVPEALPRESGPSSC